MKSTMTIALFLAITAATGATADTRIERFCGSGHINEMASVDDVKSNPDGYFVASLDEQVSEGDPRIILTNDSGFHLCTRRHTTPEMDANDVYRHDGNQTVKFLFVPIAKWVGRPTS